MLSAVLKIEHDNKDGSTFQMMIDKAWAPELLLRNAWVTSKYDYHFTIKLTN